MRYWPTDPAIRKALKLTPMRIQGLHLSSCCGRPTILVQSMAGGFVTANCSAPGCNKWSTVREGDFRGSGAWMSCPGCRRRMTPGVCRSGNYAFLCYECQLYLLLADLLPAWSDVAVA